MGTGAMRFSAMLRIADELETGPQSYVQCRSYQLSIAHGAQSGGRKLLAQASYLTG